MLRRLIARYNAWRYPGVGEPKPWFDHPLKLECPKCGDPTLGNRRYEYCLRCGWEEVRAA